MAWNQMVANPMNHPEMFRVNPGTTPRVPSLVPQQPLGLFELVDQFAMRKAQLADMQRKQQMADLAEQREGRMEEFGRRRLEAADAKQMAAERFQRARAAQEALSGATKNIGANRHPGTMVVQDENGNPVVVQWERAPGEQSSPTQSVVSSTVDKTPSTEISSPLVREAKQQFGQPQLQPPILAGMPLQRLREPMPAPPVPSSQPPVPTQAPQDTVFVDENEEGDVRALMGPGDETQQQLPIDAFPPGAKEGDRFAASDVNLRGGKGNPFAEPVPPIQLNRPGEQPGREPQSSSVEMVSPRVRGMVWRTKGMPGGEVTVDPEEARMALRDEAQGQVQNIDAALEDENIPEDVKQDLLAVRPLVVSGMNPRMALELVRGRNTRVAQGQKLEGQQEMQGERLASNERIADKRNQTALTIAEMKKKRGASGALVAGRAGGEGGAFQRLFAANPLKAERVANGVDSQIARTMRNVNFDKLTGQGINRLKLGLKMLDEGGTGEFEAMMNFFGYIRGGVPAKNESDLWAKMTRNPITVLDSIGRQLNLGALGTLAASRDMTPEEVMKLKSQKTGLSPQQHAELKRAMTAAMGELRSFGESTGEMLAKQFGQYRAPAEQELVQGKIDAIREYAGLAPKSYFGKSQPGTPAKSKPSIRDLLQEEDVPTE